MALALDATREASILQRVRGDSGADRESAFEEIFRTFRSPVLGLCRNLTSSSSEAEDALQETFLAVFRSLPGFRGTSLLSTWIYRIAVRVSLKVRARRPRLETVAEDLDAVAGAAPTPVETSRALDDAMARLSAEQRIVLSLFAVEELTHREIAHLLGIPEGTVWSRLHAAKKRLVAELGTPGRRSEADKEVT